MRRTFLLILSVINFFISAFGQTYIPENDTIIVLEDNFAGYHWVTKTIDKVEVGMTLFRYNNYGKNYHVIVTVKNNAESPILFIPDSIRAHVKNRYGEIFKLKAYTAEEYIKKIKRIDNTNAFLIAFAGGINAAAASNTTSYVSGYTNNGTYYSGTVHTYNPAVASAVNAETARSVSEVYESGNITKRNISNSYVEETTIQPGQFYNGSIKIKYQKGEVFTINIPVNDKIFTFNWNVKGIKSIKIN